MLLLASTSPAVLSTSSPADSVALLILVVALLTVLLPSSATSLHQISLTTRIFTQPNVADLKGFVLEFEETLRDTTELMCLSSESGFATLRLIPRCSVASLVCILITQTYFASLVAPLVEPVKNLGSANAPAAARAASSSTTPASWKSTAPATPTAPTATPALAKVGWLCRMRGTYLN